MNEIQKKHMMNEVKDEVIRLYEMENHSLSEILDHFHIKIEELKICAEESAALDQRMEKVKNRIIHSNQMESEFRVRSE